MGRYGRQAVIPEAVVAELGSDAGRGTGRLTRTVPPQANALRCRSSKLLGRAGPVPRGKIGSRDKSGSDGNLQPLVESNANRSIYKSAPGLPDRFIRLPLPYNISPIDQDHTSSDYNASLGFIQRARLDSGWNSKGMDLMTDIARLLGPEIPRLRRYARALTRDTTRADDLVQNCLARAVAKQHLWQEGTDLRAWLFTILHNQHVNDVRRSAREGVAVPVEEMAAALPVEANAIDALALRDLHRAMGRLPEEQRQVILLVGLEGLRYEQAAQILDVPVGTVRSRLSRGRDTLRVLMGMPEKTAETLSRGKVRAQRQRAA